jgi:hypothetical protein
MLCLCCPVRNIDTSFVSASVWLMMLCLCCPVRNIDTSFVPASVWLMMLCLCCPVRNNGTSFVQEVTMNIDLGVDRGDVQPYLEEGRHGCVA